MGTLSQLLPVLGAIVAFLFAALLTLYIIRLLFGRRIRAPGPRNRARRLDVVDAFDLDRERQLVIVRRDNTEHLLLIGGPNDLLVEAMIHRVDSAIGRPETREQRPPAPPADGWPTAPGTAPSPERAAAAAPLQPPPPAREPTLASARGRPSSEPPAAPAPLASEGPKRNPFERKPFEPTPAPRPMAPPPQRPAATLQQPALPPDLFAPTATTPAPEQAPPSRPPGAPDAPPAGAPRPGAFGFPPRPAQPPPPAALPGARAADRRSAAGGEEGRPAATARRWASRRPSGRAAAPPRPSSRAGGPARVARSRNGAAARPAGQGILSKSKRRRA